MFGVIELLCKDQHFGGAGAGHNDNAIGIGDDDVASIDAGPAHIHGKIFARKTIMRDCG